MGVVDVVALAGARDALEAGDHRLAVVGVLERHRICSPGRSALAGEIS